MSKAEVLSLYRGLIRHGSKFSNYNFKEYVLRRARTDFRQNASASPAEVSATSIYPLLPWMAPTWTRMIIRNAHLHAHKNARKRTRAHESMLTPRMVPTSCEDERERVYVYVCCE